jgi:hypothetical protein
VEAMRQYSVDKRGKPVTPHVSDWVALIPELKPHSRELTTWKAVCDFLKIEVGGQSARRKLQKWVRENRLLWPGVPDFK